MVLASFYSLSLFNRSLACEPVVGLFASFGAFFRHATRIDSSGQCGRKGMQRKEEKNAGKGRRALKKEIH